MSYVLWSPGLECEAQRAGLLQYFQPDGSGYATVPGYHREVETLCYRHGTAVFGGSPPAEKGDSRMSFVASVSSPTFPPVLTGPFIVFIDDDDRAPDLAKYFGYEPVSYDAPAGMTAFAGPSEALSRISREMDLAGIGFRMRGSEYEDYCNLASIRAAP